MENPIKMDDLGGLTPIFGLTPSCGKFKRGESCVPSIYGGLSLHTLNIPQSPTVWASSRFETVLEVV